MYSSAVQAQVRQLDRRPWSVSGSGESRSRVWISTVGIAIALAITLAAPALQAKVFASQNQALREAFPEATRIDRDSRILLKDDLAKVIGFSGKTKADRLRVGGDVHGVVGATLSAQAAARGVRRMLAYWEVLLQMPDSTESAKSPVLPMLPLLPKSAGTAEPELQEP